MAQESESKSVIISAQQKWTEADQLIRENMLNLIGWSISFATKSWKKLPHMAKANLENKSWT